MLRIRDSIAGEPISFYYVQSAADLTKALRWAERHKTLAMDTESTGVNCYIPGWQLRTFQFGNANASIVIPARYKKVIASILEMDINWIGHNGPHDIRSLDQHLGYSTGVVCRYETYIPAHHMDPRNQKEGGTGHGLKELAVAHVDPEAGKWEKALKAEFKKILIPIPGEVFKSGPRRGQPKTRVCTFGEGWGLIDPTNLAYIAYAASDPILTYRLWLWLRDHYQQFRKLYRFDWQIQQACDVLHRRAILLDVDYTRRFSRALTKAQNKALAQARNLGVKNIYSGPQIAQGLLDRGARLREKTKKGKWKTDDSVMKHQLKHGNPEVQELVVPILKAKRCTKRRDVYAEGMLTAIDDNGRVHPNINPLAARTGRMSAGIFQQLPTKNQE